MIIIGFDPGLTNTGYAILEKEANNITLIESGLIKPKKGKVIRDLSLKPIQEDIEKKLNEKISLLKFLLELLSRTQ